MDPSPLSSLQGFLHIEAEMIFFKNVNHIMLILFKTWVNPAALRRGFTVLWFTRSSTIWCLPLFPNSPISAPHPLFPLSSSHIKLLVQYALFDHGPFYILFFLLRVFYSLYPLGFILDTNFCEKTLCSFQSWCLTLFQWLFISPCISLS